MAIWHQQDRVEPLGEDLTNARTLPTEYYTDEEIFEREQEAIIKDSWQFVATTYEFDEVGDYKIVEVADLEIVLVRTEDGIEAFYNVCPHRGYPVMGEDGETGNTSVMQCPYHCWSFDLDGQLLRAPNFQSTDRNPYAEDEDIPDLDPEDDGLCSVAVETLESLVFVNVSDDPTPFEEFVGDLPDLLSKYDLEDMTHGTTKVLDIDANWKLWVDNYLECDHCAANHPSLVDTFDMEEWDSELRDYYWLHVAPADRENPGDYSPDDDENQDGEYVVMWPNFSLNVSPGPGDLTVGRIEPLGPRRTRLQFDYYFTELGEDGEMTERQRETVEWFHEIALEDLELVERQQQGIETGAMSQGRLAPQEHTIHDFHNAVMAAHEGRDLTERPTLQQDRD